MKNFLMHFHDTLLPIKRTIIETVNDQLKFICQIEYNRHRSFENFLTDLISGLIAYSLLEKKPLLKLDVIQNNQISTFVRSN